MNVTKNQIDDLNLKLTIDIAADDYAAAEHKKLSERRRTASFRGFRQGMAPMSLVKKIYGDQALYEAVNGVLSEALNTYIKDNSLRVLGEPLPSDDQEPVDWVSGNDFTFKFDIATSPELTFEVGADDKIPYYKITVTKEAKAEMKANLLRQYGGLEDTDSAGEDDYIIADLTNGTVKSEGSYISVRSVDDAARKVFVGLKPGDKIKVNVNDAFINETDRAALLKVKKEELAGIEPEFDLTVVNVRTFKPAEETQETFDKIFGEGVVKTAEEFEAKVEERVRDGYRQQADYRLSKDIRDYFMKKADVKLPEAFLKKWLLAANEGKYTAEEVEKDFPSFLEDFRWQLVRSRIMKLFSLKVEEADIHEAAESYAAYQYAMYGMGNVPHEVIHDAAHRMLADENQVRRLEEQVEDNKAIEAVKGAVTLQDKKISEEKFRAL